MGQRSNKSDFDLHGKWGGRMPIVLSCALRTRTYANLPQRLEMGDEMANSITTVEKDSLIAEQPSFRIRKLTPKECWRLMGFSDEDFDKAAKVNSNTQLYKQAGNSIVVNVLMAIFGEML